MVGGVYIAVESHSCPCFCVEARSTPTRVSAVCNSPSLSLKRKHLLRRGTMKLSSSFFESHSVNTSLKKQGRHKKRTKRLTIVNELGGQYEETFHDVKKVLKIANKLSGANYQILNYFTYKAVRTVLQQLYEMNPPQYRWFYNFVAANDPADRKRFIRSLGKEQLELAERVMITRLHLYGKWIKKCNHAEIYQEIHDENLELMRERLMETYNTKACKSTLIFRLTKGDAQCEQMKKSLWSNLVRSAYKIENLSHCSDCLKRGFKDLHIHARIIDHLLDLRNNANITQFYNPTKRTRTCRKREIYYDPKGRDA
ncbi:unnamed protein product [Sphenostylis stenocarpa]|uniref:Chaperonin-like RbcX protein 2, chloroplastic n=1 Tax=Sphenostylis stenocarpa TaxID=92480 RepID=A0AA86SVE8_9FABA|nr:unnamed protein product [Sphenostylis stenocarpa]